MKIMQCPLNGARNISEFAFGGEVLPMPKLKADLREWAEYVFIENNTLGVVREWWIHVPTSYWFIADRDTQTNEIVRTYPSDELFETRVEFSENE